MTRPRMPRIPAAAQWNPIDLARTRLALTPSRPNLEGRRVFLT